MSEQTQPENAPANEQGNKRAVIEPPGPNRLSRLILTGFMGAGKSTVGAILARDLGWRFIDLDDVIEASAKRTVAEIFREFGEAHFRECERQAVEQLGREEKIVLALGGGAVENESTRTLLIDSPGNCLVFLDAPLPELLERCAINEKTGDEKTGEVKVRPLLADPEALEDRHSRRLPHYRAAHLTVETTGLAPETVADRVLERISIAWQIETKGR